MSIQALHNNLPKIAYKKLSKSDLYPEMLNEFNRYQEVSRVWRKENNQYVIKEKHFVENWNEQDRIAIAKEDFAEALESGGFVFAGYDGDKLIGFAVCDGRFFGTENQYAWLVMLYVSYEYRGNGIGKTLFEMCVESAKQIGAKKLYISSHSSVETQAFYSKIGCVPTKEVNKKLFKLEPCDIHLEYVLDKV